MKNIKQASYNGKEVFIGIDVHKKSYSVVARCDKEVVKKWTTAASPKELSQQLQKYFSGAIIHSWQIADECSKKKDRIKNLLIKITNESIFNRCMPENY